MTPHPGTAEISITDEGFVRLHIRSDRGAHAELFIPPDQAAQLGEGLIFKAKTARGRSGVGL